MPKMTSWHVGVAAEAFAAEDFDMMYRCNMERISRSIDLIAVSGERMLKISVKGSQDGGWGLTQSYKKGCDYHEAIRKWLGSHHKKTIFCLVQFKGTEEDQMPRMYLASPAEIAEVMNASAGGRGETVLREYHQWGPRAAGSGTIDRIPEEWKFTAERAQDMFERYGQ